jgi:TonB family protein
VSVRTLLAAIFAFLPLVQAQDSPLLKSVEPNYDQYSEDLATDFVEASASVTITVLATGQPFALERSSVPLPMAVVMALQEYQFRPQGTIPHGRAAIDGSTYQVTLNVPIRQSKDAVKADAILVRPGIAAASNIYQARPEYPEHARHNRIQGAVTFEAVIGTEGYIESLKTSHGPFVLMEPAYKAAKQWQYRPMIMKGEPVDVRTEIHVRFTLN